MVHFIIKLFCYPCMLCYQAIRIFCCECILLFFTNCALAMTACCCGCLEAICCKCCCFSAKFRDKKFPPCNKSIGDLDEDDFDPSVPKTMGRVNKNQNREEPWERLEDIIYRAGHVKKGETPPLYKNGISARDIVQGGLGDCWLLSSIAALAEFPSLIRDIFVSKSSNKYGKYVIKLYNIKLKCYENIVIDTFVPVTSRGKCRFTPHIDGEMWVPLLEKACAKMLGSYAALDGGTLEKGLHILTGFDMVVFGKKKSGGDRQWLRTLRGKVVDNSSDDLFSVIRACDKRQAVMTCAVYNKSGRNVQGLIEGHAYTLIRVVKVSDNIKLLNIRNPWGQGGEWKGDWSDNSPKWAKNREACKMCRHVAKDDGCFWMEISDFSHCFDNVTIAVRSTGFSNISLDPHEECGCCGPCCGCVGGCCRFWCRCQGLCALCCADKATVEIDIGDDDKRCCA
eukprot:Tbor_TRINITY_DN3249_c0_g1::TRINITY_DN3249_c0_g1_i1::g.23759::m.23759